MNRQEERSPAGPQGSASEEEEMTPASGILVRLGWVIIGPLGLFLYFAHLVRDDPPLVSFVSLAFWLMPATTLLFRYLDVRYFAGTTLEGSATTQRALKRYATGLMATGGVAWLCAALI